MAGTGTTHLRNDVILSVTELVVEFPARKKQIVHAVSGVSFDLDEGETLGIVGLRQDHHRSGDHAARIGQQREHPTQRC